MKSSGGAFDAQSLPWLGVIDARMLPAQINRMLSDTSPVEYAPLSVPESIDAFHWLVAAKAAAVGWIFAHAGTAGMAYEVSLAVDAVGNLDTILTRLNVAIRSRGGADQWRIVGRREAR